MTKKFLFSVQLEKEETNIYGENRKAFIEVTDEVEIEVPDNATVNQINLIVDDKYIDWIIDNNYGGWTEIVS